MHDTKIVTKSLAAAQDLLRGVGKRQQNRANKMVTVNALHLFIPVASDAELAELDPVEAAGLGVVMSGSSMKYYQYGEEHTDSSIRSTVASGWWSLVGAEALKEQLADPAGFGNLGYVSSFAQLRTIVPKRAGQLCYLMSYYDGWAASATTPEGGNYYISFAGAATDDGGHVCVPTGQTAFYWAALTNEVNLHDYGIKVIPWSLMTSGNTEVDYAPRLQAAVDRAKAVKKELASDFPRVYSYSNDVQDRVGIKILKAIDITGLRKQSGSMSLFFRSDSSFTPHIDVGTGRRFALVNKNAPFDSAGKKSFGTTSGSQRFEYIHTRNCGGRNSAYPIEGQMHMTMSSIVTDCLAAEDCYGSGVWLADSYDNVINNIQTRQCGSPLNWAQQHTGYPAYNGDRSDESNSNTILSIMSHDDYDRLLCYRGTKNMYGRWHQEAPHITSTAWDLPPSATLDATLSEYGYINNFFQHNYSGMGVFNGNNNSSTSNVGPVVTLHSLVDSSYENYWSNYFDVFSGSFSEFDTSSFGMLTTGGFNLTPRARLSATSINLIAARGADGVTLERIARLNGVAANILSIKGLTTLNIQSGNNNIHYIEQTGVLTATGGKTHIKAGTVGSVVTAVPLFVGPISVTNYRHDGAATPAFKGKLDGMTVAGSVYLNSQSYYTATDLTVAGTFNTAGTNSRVFAENCKFGQCSFNPTTGFFLLRNCESASEPAVWSRANNKPTANGALNVHPTTGEWQRYVDGAWTTF